MYSLNMERNTAGRSLHRRIEARCHDETEAGMFLRAARRKTDETLRPHLWLCLSKSGFY